MKNKKSHTNSKLGIEGMHPALLNKLSSKSLLRISLQFPMVNRSQEIQLRQEANNPKALIYHQVSNWEAQGRLKAAVNMVMCESHGFHVKSILIFRSNKVWLIPLHFCTLEGFLVPDAGAAVSRNIYTREVTLWFLLCIIITHSHSTTRLSWPNGST